MMKGMLRNQLSAILIMGCLLAACGRADLNAPIPAYDTGVNPDNWASVPAGEFLSGQFNDPVTIDYDYEIMITDVTVAQYVAYINAAMSDGSVKTEGNQIMGFYPGDVFHGAKHEIEITAQDYIFVPTNDPASRFSYSDTGFTSLPGYENHPMTNVSWFGAWGYCGYYQSRLPSELEWEKAARGTADDRPYPWGSEISGGRANYYVSRDPLENMRTFGSLTTPVGFYNGKAYEAFQTVDSASPYGLYDMAGNVWQWTGNVYEGMHYRFLRGGSKDTYDMDLRIWVRNDATPTYYSPDVGFRCVRGGG